MFKQNVHYSIDLEQAVMGAFLLEKYALGRVFGILTPEVFYWDHHQKLYALMSEMWDNNLPVDLLTVLVEWTKKHGEEMGGSAAHYYLIKTMHAVVSTANLEYHSMILRQMYVERETMKITMGGIDENKDILQNIDDIQDRLKKIMQIKVTNDFKSIDEVLVDMYQHMDNVKDKDLVGITTGFNKLDKITGGLMPGGMYVVAARPSVGKSAFMGKMVLSAAMKGHKVGLVSLEMNNTQITARLSSLVSEVEFWRINRNRMRDQQQSDHFYKVVNSDLAHLPIMMSDTASVNISDIKAKVTKLKQKGQVDLLFIDYLGLIDTDGKNRNYNREQEVSKISRGIKLMAMDYEMPIVVLCQLNRMSEQGGDKKPKLHHLRESGSIEQDADGVLFIHRDWMSGNKTNADGVSTENQADIIVAKWRNGEICEYKIGFDGERMKFFETDNFTPISKISDIPTSNQGGKFFIQKGSKFSSGEFDEGFDEQ